MEAIVAHFDADGIISSSLIYKLKPNSSIYFSSHSLLLRTLCSLLTKNFSEVTILDISPNKKSLAVSSAFEKVLWIDHHVWDELEIPKNVQVFNESLESTAMLLAKILSIDNELVKIANEIDTNNVKSEDALFFRDLISAIKWKYKNYQVIKFRQIVKTLAFKGIGELEKNEELVKTIDEFNEWLKQTLPKILENRKTFEVKNKKIVLIEGISHIPVYSIFNELKNQENFDILAVFYRKVDYKSKNIKTKIELRSNKEDVLKIAKVFDGGGHKSAAGCSIDYYLTFEDFLKKIENLL